VIGPAPDIGADEARWQWYIYLPVVIKNYSP